MKQKKVYPSLFAGFTLIELLVVIAIIGTLATIVLAAVGSSRAKGADARLQSQLKQMVAQSNLYTGANSAVAATTNTSDAVVGAAGGNLFTDNVTTDRGLFNLITKLPAGTVIYYGASGSSPISGGTWAFAAALSNGSFCVDHTGTSKIQTTTVMTALNAATLYPNMGTFSCQ